MESAMVANILEHDMGLGWSRLQNLMQIVLLLVNDLSIIITEMNEEQRAVFNAVVAGHSVLLTSRAGCGKSYTLSNIIEHADANGIIVGITATTGCAALLLKGTTIHSFLGIGLGTKPVDELVRDCLKKRFAQSSNTTYNRLKALQLLIIDEISMMSDTLFDLISVYLSKVRGDIRPFGGIQIILCGDLYQIPPVNGKFFFHAAVWQSHNNIFKKFDLKKSQRHSKDPTFDLILQKLRTGECDNETLAALKATENNVFPNGIKPTVLYLKNVDVDLINKHELDKLVDGGAIPREYILQSSQNVAGKAWIQSCKVPETITLCEGAQVMLTWNIDLQAGLCNGSRGIIVSLNKDGAYVNFIHTSRFIGFIKIEHPEQKDTWIKYLPLRLAYALTVNKSQSMTLDAVVVDMNISASPDFLYAKFYTAISRVRSLSDIVIMNAQKRLFVAHPEVLEMYASDKMKSLDLKIT
jgi:ATP-dependent DNA helicase PIF1